MDRPAAPATASPAGLPAAPACPADRVPVLAWLTGALFAAAELALSGRYGFQQDELYFIEAGHHLALGYVDQPPLTPLLTRVTDILGVSPTAMVSSVVATGRRMNGDDRLMRAALRVHCAEAHCAARYAMAAVL